MSCSLRFKIIKSPNFQISKSPNHQISRSTNLNMRISSVTLLIAFTGFGCSTARDLDSQATETVSITVNHRLQRGTLWIEGTTDLPTGAELTYTVRHEMANTVPVDEWPATNLVESGRAVVQDGQFWGRGSTNNWPAGQVTVLIQFPLPPQPEEVIARYGEFGEKLTGENVVDVGGVKAVEVTHTFQIRR